MEENKNTQNSTEDAASSARGLIIRILKERGVSYKEHDDDVLSFCYEGNGEVIPVTVYTEGESSLVRLVDYEWHSVSKWDMEEVIRLQSKLNQSNSLIGPRVVYAFADDDEMKLTTIHAFPMVDDMPFPADYLTRQLNDLYYVRKLVLETDTDGNESEDGKGGES